MRVANLTRRLLSHILLLTILLVIEKTEIDGALVRDSLLHHG